MDLTYIKKHEVVKNQIKKINNSIIKIKTKLFIATAAYDKYYKKYYRITLVLFILSSFVTFIEALRLIIVENVNKSDQILININLLNTLINVLVLSLGIVITILSSYIRFKNYREILEELREKQNIIIEYIDKYKKQKNNLEYIYQIKEDDINFEEIEKIKNDIAEYDTKIESTNILEYLTTKDIIKFNDYKGDFDIKMKEIVLKYNKKLKTLKEEEENINIINLQKDIDIDINIIDDKNVNVPYIIVQSYYEPNKFIQPNYLFQPIQYIQPKQINQSLSPMSPISSQSFYNHS
jgi:hypothetical protein